MDCPEVVAVDFLGMSRALKDRVGEEIEKGRPKKLRQVQGQETVQLSREGTGLAHNQPAF